MELEQYRTRLEQMVEEKSKDLIAIQENLEATNRRQALFIKVLQILQLEPDIPTAMNMAINVWNDLLLPRIFLTDSSKMTLPVGLTNFQAMYSTDYVGMIAAVIITIIPSIVVYILLHKQIMEGMVAGAVKG